MDLYTYLPYIYIYIYIQTAVYRDIYTDTHVCTQIYMYICIQASAQAVGYTPEMWDNNKGPTSLPPLPAAPFPPPFKREPKP